MTARILITGSRNWTDVAVIESALATWIPALGGVVTVVHGGASGADALADALVPTFGPHVSRRRYAANWNGPCRAECQPGHRRPRKGGGTYCPAAGNYRNAEMVAAGADVCLAFPLGESTGTRDCMRRAKAAGIKVIDLGDGSET